ncbi:outer membrane beta-barrel protein [Geomonas oryzae]|uniref:outer membrane beta-barrel protein n=1 Tax=Geomonas oryzae TaxID=2364273 RepID=UPI00100BD663
MKRIFLMMIALSLSLLICGPVRAQHIGPYVGANFGVNLLMDAKATDELGNFNMSYSPALQWSAVVGWDLKPNSSVGEGRVELEYTRRSNSLDSVEFVEGKVSGGGDLTADSLLLNCIGMIRDESSWSPYILIGLGAARLDASGLKVSGQPLSTDTTTVFAYQLGTGVDYALTDALSLDFGYRFFGTTAPTFTEPGGQRFKTDYFSHSVDVGLRVGF